MKKSAAAENFVPFEPDVPAGPAVEPSLRLKVMAKGGSAGTPNGPGQFAPLSDPAAAPSPASAHSGHPQASVTPVVTLQREGDRVTGIRVECSCGQVIELACSY